MKQRFFRLSALLLVLLLVLLPGLSACSVGQLVEVLDEAAGQIEDVQELPLYEPPEESETQPAEQEQPAVQEKPAEQEQPAVQEEPAEQEQPEVQEEPAEEIGDATDDVEVVYGETYDTPEMVAAYLHQYRELPPNFISKYDAQDKGWDSSKGNLWKVAPGCSIGGDTFGNREGLLPKGKYHECDVNYAGGYRGSERIVWSTDGAIYYTNDHYESFTQLYEGWAS